MLERQDAVSQRSETQCFSGDEDGEPDLSLDQDQEDSGVTTPTRKKDIKVKKTWLLFEAQLNITSSWEEFMRWRVKTIYKEVKTV